MDSFLSLYSTIPDSSDLDISAVLAPLAKTHVTTINSQLDAALTALLCFAEKYDTRTKAISLLRSFTELLLAHIQNPENDCSVIMSCKGLWPLIGQLLLKVPEAAKDFAVWFTNRDACKALLSTDECINTLTLRKLFNLIATYTRILFSKDSASSVGAPEAISSLSSSNFLKDKGAFLYIDLMAKYLQGFIGRFAKADLSTFSVQDIDKPAFSSTLQMIVQICRAHNPTFANSIVFKVPGTAKQQRGTGATHGSMLVHLCVQPDDFHAYTQDDNCAYSQLLQFLHPESSPVLAMLVADAEKLVHTSNVDWAARYYVSLFKTIMLIDSFSASKLLTKLPQRLSPLAKPIYGKAVSCAVDRLQSIRRTHSKTFWRLVSIQLSAFNIFPSDTVLMEMQNLILKHGKASIFISRMIGTISHKLLSKQELRKVVSLYTLFLTEGDAPTAGIVKTKMEELIREFPTALQDNLPTDLYIKTCLRSNISIEQPLLNGFLLSILSLTPGTEQIKGCTMGLFVDFIITCLNSGRYYVDFCAPTAAQFKTPPVPLEPFFAAINNTFGTNLYRNEYALLFRFFFGGANSPNVEIVHTQLQSTIKKYQFLLSDSLKAEMLSTESKEYAPIGFLLSLFAQGGLNYFLLTSKEAKDMQNIIVRYHVNEVVTLQTLLLGVSIFAHIPEQTLSEVCSVFVDECTDSCNLRLILSVANRALLLYSLLLSTDTSSVEIPRRMGKMFSYFIGCCHKMYRFIENEDFIGIILCLSNIGILCKSPRALVLQASINLEVLIEHDAQQALMAAGMRTMDILNYIFNGANTTETGPGSSSLLAAAYNFSPSNSERSNLRSPEQSPSVKSTKAQSVLSPNGTSILVNNVSIRKQLRSVNSPAYRMLWLYTPFFLELLEALATIAEISLDLHSTCLHVPMGWISFGINRPSELHSSEFGALLSENIYVPVIDHYGIKQHGVLWIDNLISECIAKDEKKNGGIDNQNDLDAMLEDSFKVSEIPETPEIPDVSLFTVNTILPYPISPSRYEYSMSQRFSVPNESLSMLLSIYPMAYTKRLFGCLSLWRAFFRTNPSEAMRQLAAVPFFITTLNCRTTAESIGSLYSSLINTLVTEVPLAVQRRFSALLNSLAMLLFDRFRTIPHAFSHKRRSYGIVNAILCLCHCSILSIFTDHVVTFLLNFLADPKHYEGIACHENVVSYIHLVESIYLSFLTRDGKNTSHSISYEIGSEAIIAAIDNISTSNWELHNAWLSLYGSIAKTTFYNMDIDRRKLVERIKPASLTRIGSMLEKLIYTKDDSRHLTQQILCASMIYAHVRDIQNDDLRLFKSIAHLLFSSNISLRALAGKIFATQFENTAEQIVVEVLCWLRTAEFAPDNNRGTDAPDGYELRKIQFCLSMLPDIKGSPISRRICTLLSSQYSFRRYIVCLLESLAFVLYHADCSGNELCYGIFDLLQRLKVPEVDILIIKSRAYSLRVRE